ncbi:Nn.00g106690.m01.CDS01 [Neocucurbitaria sp. VM-36]
MATPTVPTVSLPLETDTDDESDDDLSSLLPAPPPTATVPAQSQPLPATDAPAASPVDTGLPGQATGDTSLPGQTLPGTINPSQTPTTVVPGAASTNTASASTFSSATGFADTLPSDGVNSSASDNAATSNDKGLSSGAAAGIGVAVGIAVILIAIGAWIFTRRRRRQWQKKRKSSRDSSSHGYTPDEEIARNLAGSEVRAYRATGGAVEMGHGKELDADEKGLSELDSPTMPVEAIGDREFAAELPGSMVPMRGVDKGNGERLFDDAPIDARDDPVEAEPRMVDKKG